MLYTHYLCILSYKIAYTRIHYINTLDIYFWKIYTNFIYIFSQKISYIRCNDTLWIWYCENKIQSAKFIPENRRGIYFRKHFFYIFGRANVLYSAAIIRINTNMMSQEEAAKRSTDTREPAININYKIIEISRLTYHILKIRIPAHIKFIHAKFILILYTNLSYFSLTGNLLLSVESIKNGYYSTKRCRQALISYVVTCCNNMLNNEYIIRVFLN